MAAKATAGNEESAAVERMVDWHNVSNWGTYLQQIGATQADVALGNEVLGDGFEVLSGKEGKSRLVNVPLMICEWSFTTGDYADEAGTSAEYVFVRAITQSGAKVAFTDGGQGIYGDLKSYTDRTGKRVGPILVNGLARSDFDTTDAKGNPVRGTIFRFDYRPVAGV